MHSVICTKGGRRWATCTQGHWVITRLVSIARDLRGNIGIVYVFRDPRDYVFETEIFGIAPNLHGFETVGIVLGKNYGSGSKKKHEDQDTERLIYIRKE